MNRLKKLRVSAGLPLRVLEKYLNIPNATLSLIENGKQPMREIHVQKITNFFDVTSDYLLGYSNTGIGIYFASLREQIVNKLNSYDTRKLEKLLMFMKEYI